jgi:hypothetical protein
MNGGPRAGGQGDQLGLFHEDGRPAVPPPAGNPTARDLYRFENLWRAYRECRRTKRGTLNALAFEQDAEANLFTLQDELLAHRYRPGKSICFVTDGPKPREGEWRGRRACRGREVVRVVRPGPRRFGVQGA